MNKAKVYEEEIGNMPIVTAAACCKCGTTLTDVAPWGCPAHSVCELVLRP